MQGGIACELVQTGSLYHDDVMDEADTRRGVDTVNAKWGNLQAILAGDFLLSRASEIAASLGTEVAGLLARTIGRLCEGQIEELRHTYNAARPEVSYLVSISGKTASLYATAARIGGIVAELRSAASSTRSPSTARRSAWCSRSSTTCSTSRPPTSSSASPPATTWSKACTRCRCCARCRPAASPRSNCSPCWASRSIARRAREGARHRALQRRRRRGDGRRPRVGRSRRGRVRAAAAESTATDVLRAAPSALLATL